MRFEVKPITKTLAVKYTELHPHARSLPNSAKFFMALYIDSYFRGLAAWGYGVKPKQLPVTLFGKACANNTGDYLELCRFFVDNDNVPEHTASKFLAITHRLLKRYTKVKYLFTYAAGFQGLIGTIYKACGYEHITRQDCRLIYIPEMQSLVHPVSFWHRYHFKYRAETPDGYKLVKRIFPNAKIWCGYNYRYLYWLCDKKERERLMQTARFKVEPYPSKDNIRIWLEDENGFVEDVDIAFAKKVPIIKLKTNRAINMRHKQNS